MTTFTALAIQKAKERQEKYQKELAEAEARRIEENTILFFSAFEHSFGESPDTVKDLDGWKDGIRFRFQKYDCSAGRDLGFFANLGNACPKCHQLIWSQLLRSIEDLGDFLDGNSPSGHTCEQDDIIDTPL